MIKDEAQASMRARGNGWEYEEEKIICGCCREEVNRKVRAVSLEKVRRDFLVAEWPNVTSPHK